MTQVGQNQVFKRLSLAGLLSLLFLTHTSASADMDGAPGHSGHRHKFVRGVDICDLVPKTQQRFPEKLTNAGSSGSGVSKKSFFQVIQAVTDVYEPIFRQEGARLVIRGLWNINEPNAIAYPGRDTMEQLMEKEGEIEDLDLTIRRVDIWGGLARHPDMTVDGLLMVACHEVGHHLGGFPVKKGSWGASNEGQSDYFAASKCARRIYSKLDAVKNGANIDFVKRSKIDQLAVRRCYSAHQHDQAETAICVRTAMAGLSITRVLASLGGESPTEFNRPDRSVVKTTDNSHPAAQCRLDTYFNGALCRVSYNVDFSSDDPFRGACVPERTVTGSAGYRPNCWFHPKHYKTTYLTSAR